jgi:predicted secreted acid phosphatase
MNKVILCDIDGTISDATHRLHLIQTKPKQWKEFFNESTKDPIYEDVHWLVNLFHTNGNKILFVTARPENERDKTIEWLHNTAGMKGKYEKLYMRYPGDYRDDYIVKKDILQDIRNDGYDPFLALDDRDGVVNMWREEGIFCFQVRSAT